MNQRVSLAAWIVWLGPALLLTGCGGSQPAANPAPNYKPSTGVFAAIDPQALAQGAGTTNLCNLDAVNGATPGSQSLPRGATALFAGWAASGDGNAVPRTVELLLIGAQSYGVRAATGQVRLDVAAATQKARLVHAGYQVQAGVSAVAAGAYKVELRYQAAGKAWVCKTAHSVTIQ